MNDSIHAILFAAQQRNLVYNHNFLYYSNEVVQDSAVTFNHPDGWIYQDSGPNGEISFDGETCSCLIQKSNGDAMMTFNQVISEFPRWQKVLCRQKVTACAVLLNPAAAKTSFELTFSINDGISTSSKSLVFNAGDKKNICIELNVSENATKLEVAITCPTKNAIIYVEKVYANIGDVALDTLPCMVSGVIGERKQYIGTENPPEEELSLCNPAVELDHNYTRLNSVLNNRFGTGKNGYAMLLDMRGYFSRAWDNGAQVDPDAGSRTEPGTGIIKGDHVSTFEKDIFLEHDHGLNFAINKTILSGDKAPATIIDINGTSRADMEADGKETRPKNITELYTIKWA
ncbi:hypothetical protein [Pedobacter metabolipauper]|uniref:Tail collar domain n=1 Tax=Pedobacter metabolipauper TaxID=425513 RepID=A0A4R6SVE1_9SPHI|nr:hypothetical protein [Pedobacter metabolipauper]TDQ08419.1 hypothetical protein ATK78_2932 [Pedobacter metabolipauper]